MIEKVLGMREVEWIALQAIFAGTGVIGLFFYTLYTRRMMKLSEESRRADITPIFSIQSRQWTKFGNPFHVQGQPGALVSDFAVEFKFRNIGRGPAIAIQAWDQAVSEQFLMNNQTILIRPHGATPEKCSALELMSGSSTSVSFGPFESGKPHLFVIECSDSANGKHQLQIFRPAGVNVEETWTMQHALGETFGERFVARVQRFVQIVHYTKQELKKLFG